jgi:hypothetical protein
MLSLSPSIATRGTRITLKQTYTGHRLTLWLLLCVVSVLSVGCPTSVPYQPNEGLVATLGVAPARQRLREIVARSVNPQVTESEVTDDFLQYRFRQAIAGFPTGAILENRIHFLNVGRIEVFENNLVIVRTGGDAVLAQFVFGNYQDARMFADLLTSFRAQRARGSSGIR